MSVVVEKVLVGLGSEDINRFPGRVRRVRRGPRTECRDHKHSKGWQRKKIPAEQKETARVVKVSEPESSQGGIEFEGKERVLILERRNEIRMSF